MKGLLALWLALSPAAPPPPELCSPYNKCQTSEAGERFIQEMEGFMPFVYLDVAGKPTIGFGHLVVRGEKFSEPLLPDDAAKLMRKDLNRIEGGMWGALNSPLKQQQFDALASFTYNLGVGAFKSSTLLKRVNAGRHEDVPAQLLRWVNAGNPPRPVNGLIKRRKLEGALYDS